MEKFPTFEEYRSKETEKALFDILNLENINESEIQNEIDARIQNYLSNGGKIEDLMNESVLGKIIGGLTGFALGKSVGAVVARVLGVEKGILYDLLTSRLVGAALGAAIGDRLSGGGDK